MARMTYQRRISKGVLVALLLAGCSADLAETARPPATTVSLGPTARPATPARPTPSSSGGVMVADPKLSAQVDAIMEDFIGSTTPGGVVIVVRDGQVLHEAAYGMANLEDAIPLTTSSVFHLASVGKQFTAMGVMILAEEGKLDYDDPIGQYLPQLARFGDELTIRHLLHHTSGIPDTYDGKLGDQLYEIDSEPTNADVLALLAKTGKREFKPGAQFSYNNTGYDMLGSLIEQLSGQRFPDFMQQRIFGPLGMTHTFSVPNPGRVRAAEVARSYTGDASEPEYYDDDELDGLVGSGSIYSNVEDMALYEQALFTNRLVKQSTLAEAFASGRLNNGAETGYGFGWNVDSYDGKPYISHDGSWLGFLSYYGRLPARRLAVIVLLNRDYDVPDEDLAAEIGTLYLEP